VSNFNLLDLLVFRVDLVNYSVSLNLELRSRLIAKDVVWTFEVIFSVLKSNQMLLKVKFVRLRELNV
jgi:hypothetical protein